MDNRIVETNSIGRFEILVSKPIELRLNLGESKDLTRSISVARIEIAIIEELECFESLLSIDYQKLIRVLFTGEKNSRHG